jgi:formylglycine-generating enzyme required for sulfatase activity
VTFREWDACVADGACNGYHSADQGWGRGIQPVINVSWTDAQAYVAWLSRKMGKSCRLPSEAEWEYAARAGTTAEYALPAPNGSDDIKGKGLANCTDCGSQWDFKRATPIGQFPANAWGLHDMHGNVWEWVEDCFHDNYASAPEDGRAWGEEKSGDCSYRVLRGGSLLYDQVFARSAHRRRHSTYGRGSSFGFRVVCSSP